MGCSQETKMCMALTIAIVFSSTALIAHEIPEVVVRNNFHPTITIAGTCLDQDGNPVVDADVRLYARYSDRDEYKQLIRVRSDSRGEFDFGRFARPGLPGVHYGPIGRPSIPVVPIAMHVVVLKMGLATAILLPDRTPDKLEAVLRPAAELRGTVLGPDGPVSGATVRSAVLIDRDVNSAVTDENGHFTISDLPPLAPMTVQAREGAAPKRQLGLVVEHPDFGSRQAFYAQCPGTVDVQLERPAIVSGTVVDPDGRVAAGVSVVATATRAERIHRRWGRASTTTDASGRYELKLQGVRQVSLRVEDRRFAPNDKRRRRAMSPIDAIDVMPGGRHRAPDIRLRDDAVVASRN